MCTIIFISHAFTYIQFHIKYPPQAVRACYNIHLVSKNQVNKTTAKATLTQMLNIIFHRMETFDLRAREEAKVALKELEAQAKKPKEPLSSAQTTPEADLPCGSYMYPAVYINLEYIPMGNKPISLIPASDGAGSYGTPEFASILHKDAYLLFRALCKLSNKSFTDDPSQGVDPIALQSKVLSLELLLSILEHAGPSFKSSDKFIYLVRSYLCVSLLKNATSSNTQIVGLSLRIFVAMIAHFKDYLKAEIEVFISNIFLRILESENSSFEHKMLVLEVFFNLCQDPVALVEIFMNYDCDFGATNMYKRIVDALSKVAKGRTASDTTALSAKRVQEEYSLRMLGLEGLVAITHSLVKSGGLDESSDTVRKDAVKDKGDEGPGEEDFKLDGSHAAGASAQHQSSGGVVQSFDRKQKLQEEFETGVLKFNLSPNKGIAYFIANKHIENTPADVARFLHDFAEKLSKTAIGEYLGKEKEYQGGFCVKVLHEYVDMMDFREQRFDEAIRHYLSGFRLPGEAQKIDRMMEKFAERFCLQNPSVFPSADTAFILSFSIIMLNTDLHNPSVREDKKMTKEDFIRNNRGISAGSDLREQFLIDIYERIKKSPISLKEDDDLRAKIAPTSNPLAIENPFLNTLINDKKKKEAYQKEREAMVKASEALFKQRKKKDNRAYVSTNNLTNEYVRPMFEVSWPPMLSVFSQVIETTDDPKMIALALMGFKHSIRVAARFQVPIARDTFINSLYKFTTLEMVKYMKPKNIECIRTLLNISLTDGNYLQESWLKVRNIRK